MKILKWIECRLWGVALLIAGLCSLASFAIGQPSFNAVQVLSFPPQQTQPAFTPQAGLPEFYSGNPPVLINGANTGISQIYDNYYLGSIFDVYTQPGIWLNGLDQPANNLNSLIVSGNAPCSYILYVDQITGIIGCNDQDQRYNPNPPNLYLLIPTTNPMQAQMTATENQLGQALDQVASLQKQMSALQTQVAHLTNSVAYYKNGAIQWENEALAWEARAFYCQSHQGKC